MNTKKDSFNKASVIIALSVILGTVAYAWTGAPVGTPPANNVAAPINVGDTEQTKGGSVIFNGTYNPIRIVSSWTGYTLNTDGPSNHAEIANDTISYNALMIAGNKSGDGVNRKVKLYDDVDIHQNLNVGNAVKIGNTTTSCSPSNAGSIRFNAGAFEGCNGTVWEALSNMGGGSCPKVEGRYQFSVTSNITAYNLYSQAVLCGGINLLIAQDFTVTISSGIDVGSFNVGNLASGSTVTIVNNGRMFGVGGVGGAGGSSQYIDLGDGPQYIGQSAGEAGSPGGNAITLKAGVTVSIDNATGYIYGGGGGGGGTGYGGGGGGAGYPVGIGSYGVWSTGSNGTLFVGGSGSTYGSAGGNSATAGSGSGGAAGNAVKLNGGTVNWVSGNDASHVIGAVN